MSNVTLNWRERNPDETGHKIYRSTTSIDVNALPTPIAEVGADVESWEDTTADAYTAYYYRVSSVRNDLERISREIYVPSVPVNMGVGPDQLVGGDLRKAGFFGEVSTNDFITGNDLASQIGLTAGTSQYSTEPWLKFCLDGEILFVNKKPIRLTVSWADINNVGTVTESQNTTVSIGGDNYLVTLLRGGNQDPVPDEYGYDLWWTHGSEWNRLMYPIHSGVHTEANNPISPSTPYNQWASYSDSDLLVHRDFGDGSYNWCQEFTTNSSNRLFRGGNGVTYADRNSSTNAFSTYGFRAALRLVQ